MKVVGFFLAFMWLPVTCKAETGYAAWLRYAPIDDSNVRLAYRRLPAVAVALDPSGVEDTAQKELVRGIQAMLGRTLRVEKRVPAGEDCILLGTVESVRRVAPEIAIPQDLIEDGYFLKAISVRGHSVLLITALNGRGVLYGTHALLRKVALHERLDDAVEERNPYVPVRWTNEWDNLNGSIERGYGGRSIFFDDGAVVPDLGRAGDYARLLSSVGLNGCTVNNVNADSRVLSDDFLPQLARIANVFRPWGVRLSISVDFSSPQTVGHLNSFDPLDPNVAAWWTQKTEEIYKLIPDFGGMLLKADSEGRVGPSTYNRTHADAANVIARALKPHGGVLIYRGFVYNHKMDWQDTRNDRAKAAYDNFAKLDGQFDDNVMIQIKYGPIDFQVREPVSPLFFALQHTNETIEFQVAQEYTGQQRHLCFLLPMWKEVLDLDMRPEGNRTPVKDLVAGRAYRRPLGGFVAVSNVGQDQNWLGYDLAMANLYAFGRIAWDADLPAKQIVDEWIGLTFGSNDHVVETIRNPQLSSWRVYENYTGFLGVGGLTDIIKGPNGAVGNHYGPGLESSERNGWGQWHRADENGVGMDRTIATGTGYIGQYPPDLASTYESMEKCPDDLLLFMHHASYKLKLHSGKTIIQYIYDSHYDGAAEAQTFPEQWKLLRGLIDDDRYQAVLSKLEYQAGHAVVWRDAVCNWFRHASSIPDASGRVGFYPNRIEAESMSLDGYTVQAVIPWEGASGGKAIVCPGLKCAATTRFRGKAGWYNLSVEYFDQADGKSRFQLQIGNQVIGEWIADDTIPTDKPDAHSSTRRKFSGVALRPGDEIRIVGSPDKGERAPVDYLEVSPANY